MDSNPRIKTPTINDKPDKLYIVAYKTLQNDWAYMQPTIYLSNARRFAKLFKKANTKCKILKYTFDKFVKKEKKT